VKALVTRLPVSFSQSHILHFGADPAASRGGRFNWLACVLLRSRHRDRISPGRGSDRARPAVEWASYSTQPGSPVGDTMGGTFRFSCSVAQAPCKLSVKAAFLSDSGGSYGVSPRVLIHRTELFDNTVELLRIRWWRYKHQSIWAGSSAIIDTYTDLYRARHWYRRYRRLRIGFGHCGSERADPTYGDRNKRTCRPLRRVLHVQIQSCAV